jgi:TRAP-type transport system periplasmic protein
MWSMKNQGYRMVAGFVLAGIVAAGCSAEGAGDKAGGSGEPVALRMATVNGDLGFTPQIEYLVDRVEELSEGNVRIEIVYEVGSFAPVAEQKVVSGVAEGKFDLGFAGTQVFESLGFNNFQALIAPMLIDSYALESSVIESGMTEQMMQGLDDLGVTGLKVLAGALRKPVAVKRPLLGPDDWRGITFGIFKSDAQAVAVRALAATPSQVIGDARDVALEKGSIDGFESSLLAYAMNGQQRSAPYMTANVNLWPQTLLVMGNPDVLDALSAEQRGWLLQAADDAADRSADLVNTDAETMDAVCEGGGRLADASESEVAALQEEFTSAYATLGQDPQTSEFIDQIQALKQSTTPEAALTIPTGCTGKAPEKITAGEGSAPTYLNGTYRYTITKEDVIKHDMGDPADYPTTNTVMLEGGKFSVRGTRGGFSGIYSVENDRITFEVPEYGVANTFIFSVNDAGDLHLTPGPLVDPGDAFEFSVHPWTRIR